MMFEIPMWDVYFRDGDKDWRLMVAGDDVEAILRTLITFNGMQHVEITRKPGPTEQLAQAQDREAK